VKAFLLWLGCIWLRSLRISPLSLDSIPVNSIIVLWHGHLPICIRVFSHSQIHVLISKSKDGDWAAKACQKFGYRVYRGSTSNGGSIGMRQMVRTLEHAPSLTGMALDGPRGPRHVCKPGALWLSQITSSPLQPVFIHAPLSFKLSTWDECVIPLPFSKIKVELGKPLYPKNLSEIERAMQELKTKKISA